MKNTIEKYDPGKIQLIRKYLEQKAPLASPFYYEIYVDSVVVVRKTKETEWFNNHESFVNRDSQRITIKIYPSENSRRYVKHIFLLKENREEITNESFMPEIEKKILERICQERERWENEHIKKELEETKRKLVEAEQYIDALLVIIQNDRLNLHQ